MTNSKPTPTKLKQISELITKEVDMIYSLSRIGWTDPEIGRRYQISASDVRKVIENYLELRELSERRPRQEGLSQNLELPKKKPRKRRSDAIYATAKDRQAAYRARLKEKHHADVH